MRWERPRPLTPEEYIDAPFRDAQEKAWQIMDNAQPTTSTPAPMTWEAFVEMATAEGWEMPTTANDNVKRKTVNGFELVIWDDCDLYGDHGQIVLCLSLELAYAAANSVAEAVGGWRC